MFDHLGFAVSDVRRSKAFYGAALAPLGISIQMDGYGWLGFGRDGRAQFWIGEGDAAQGPVHVAFTAESREQVRQFYAAALAAGGTDNGPPGLREIYHPSYYGAFVLDPDGHNIEAVCHLPE